jgi:hypothetical protein
MIVKMVVPTAGRRDTMGAGKWGMANTPQMACGFWQMPPGAASRQHRPGLPAATITPTARQDPTVPDTCPTLRRDGDQIVILDQTRLPWRETFVRLDSLDAAAAAIRDMQVRGAPLIGATAAFGIALALRHDGSDAALQAADACLRATRPTAVNLHWALDRMQAALRPCPPLSAAPPPGPPPKTSAPATPPPTPPSAATASPCCSPSPRPQRPAAA